MSEEKKPKDVFIKTSQKQWGDILYEEIYDPIKDKCCFCGWDKKKKEPIIMDEFYNDNGDISVHFIPIKDALLEKKCVILPVKPIDYETIADLELEIDCFIETWLDINKDYRQKAVWYVLLTWIIDKLYTIPYLRALGDTGTGKTRFEDVIGGICYKPMYVGGSVRSAPIYRTIDLWRGTAIFDEFTLNRSDEKEDIIQILNNGYERGKPVLRCKDGNYSEVECFDPFGPKIIATRKEFTDKALESRCITETMTTTSRTDVPCYLTKEFFDKRTELQNKLLMYRFKNLDEIRLDNSINIDLGKIQPRIKQSLMPFTVLFQNNQERLQDFIGYAKDYNNRIIEENSNSLDGIIVNTFLQLKNNCEPSITSNLIANKIVTDGHFKDLNSRIVGKHLKALGFENKPKYVENKTIRDVTIKDEKFEILKQKYVLEIPKGLQQELEGV